MKPSQLGPGTKSVARGSTFKVPRAPMQRKRTRRNPADQRARDAFHAVSRGKLCVVCGDEIVRWSHHAIYEQHLPAELKNDPRNALPVGDRCHRAHHDAVRRIPVTCLTETNLQFANDVLGEGAGHYVNRRYAT